MKNYKSLNIGDMMILSGLNLSEDDLYKLLINKDQEEKNKDFQILVEEETKRAELGILFDKKC